ncbi:RagB/SusD family nutrient uptake outer membrane protein [Chitinophaga defluvii]|uniref:RagB/SusD family nutrient uptake outer membrane protein n=1 Tax=Chitinophaga defluvii TaxID=3163343 RepID=A0ABV2TCK0_9BACT
MKIFRYILFILPLCIVASSCKKYLELNAPKDQLLDKLVFTTDESATAAVVGIYNQMVDNPYEFAAGATTKYVSLSADELDYTVSDQDYEEYENNALMPRNAYLSLLWSPCYKYIYQSSACIAGIEKSGTITAGVKQQLLGEAKFLRAFCYFYLVNFFGEVPLITGTDFEQNAIQPKTAEQKVYEYIVTDLKDAKALLSSGYVTGEKVRANSWSAAALLARVYLYMQDWEKAGIAANEVIQSGLYLPLSHPDSVFLKNSKEAIWQLMPTNSSINTREGVDFIPAVSPSALPFFVIKEELLESFEEEDIRRKSWIGIKTVEGKDYAYPYKYKVNRTVGEIKEYYTVFRLAEQYLIRAEARAHLGQYDGSREDVNAIRKRAGLSGITAAGQAGLLAAIERERRIEFMFEWGHRWFDLKRTPAIDVSGKTRADEVLSLIKPNWRSTAVIYPVPQAEIDANPFLKQSPGYE